MTVTSARRSISKPDRGIIEFDNALINQDGDVVMTMKGMGMNRCRNPDANP
jgi:acyl dehydratase